MGRPALDQRTGRAPGLPRTIVTGATSGVGWALAHRLIEIGVPVVAIGRNEERLRALAARDARVATYAADLGELGALPVLVARIVSEHPDVGCLINNAGIQNDLRLDDARCDAQGLRREVDVNLVAPMVLAQALLAHLRHQPAAWIVNVGSVLGHAPKRTAATYSATKAGLHLFTRALRVQMEGTGVRVVEAVLPLVDTPMTAGRGSAKLSAESAAQRLIEGLLAGEQDLRIGRARWLPWLQRWAPAVLERVLQRG